MAKKNLVLYLFTKYDDEISLLNFIKNYTYWPAGETHKLLICFKLIDKKKIPFLVSLLKNINFIKFIDPHKLNDFDFGSYKRVARLYPHYNILFLNSHSYPNTDFWLTKLLKHYKNKTLIATSASYESLFSSLKLKKFYKIFSFLIKKINYKKKFYPFPNPHIRTANFFIKGSDFLMFIKNKKIFNKEDAWQIESGKNSLTNYFIKKSFKIFIVNSDGDKFTLDKCKFSETFNYKKQKKTIISDKHTRKYLKLTNLKKKVFEYNTWGA